MPSLTQGANWHPGTQYSLYLRLVDGAVEGASTVLPPPGPQEGDKSHRVVGKGLY